MRRLLIVTAAMLVALMALGGLQASADRGGRFSAKLSGFDEVPTLSVAGTGTFSASLDRGGASLSFTLRYDGLTGDALFAHIHLGKPATLGGVSAFLCGGGGQAACPTGTSGTVTGTIDASHVVGPEGQGIAPGEFAELITALQAGATYVNVHTTLFPSGEIRGAIL